MSPVQAVVGQEWPVRWRLLDSGARARRVVYVLEYITLSLRVRTKPKLPLYAEDRCCSGCCFALVQTQQEMGKGLEGWRWRDAHRDGDEGMGLGGIV